MADDISAIIELRATSDPPEVGRADQFERVPPTREAQEERNLPHERLIAEGDDDVVVTLSREAQMRMAESTTERHNQIADQNISRTNKENISEINKNSSSGLVGAGKATGSARGNRIEILV